MKRHLLMLTALVVTGTACRAGAADAVLPGQAAYLSKCASCHSKDGKGNKVMVKPLKVTLAELDVTDAATLEKKDEELLGVVTKGVRRMPGFNGKLDADKIKEVLAYVRGLAKAP